MSDIITLSELDTLKIAKEQLQFELLVERMQKQVNDAQRARDAMLHELLNPYLLPGTTLTDYMVNTEKGTLELRAPDDSPLQ